MGGPWEGHGRAMGGHWEDHGRAMGGPWWELGRLSVGAMGGPWEGHGGKAGGGGHGRAVVGIGKARALGLDPRG